MTVEASLPELSTTLLSALRRAEAANAGEQEQKDFSRLSQTLTQHKNAVMDVRWLLGTGSLPLLAEEAAAIANALTSVLVATRQARTVTAQDPQDLRRGPAWKVLDESSKSLRQTEQAVLRSASDRLIAEHPAPGSNVLGMLADGDPRRVEFQRARAAYDDAAQVLTCESEVADFLRIAERFDALAKNIERHAVPDEHRGEWTRLVRGTLRLTELSPGFRSWLDQEDYAGRVVLRLGDR